MTRGDGTILSDSVAWPEPSAEMTWTVNPVYQPFLAERGIVDARGLMRAASIERLSKPGLNAWRERYHLVLGTSGGKPVHLYIKRYRCPPSGVARAALRHCPGACSLAGVEWTWIRELEARGVHCPAPVALGEHLQRGVERESLCVTAGAPGKSLEQWFNAIGTGAPVPAAFLRGVLAPLAELVRRLHASGFVHRDLYAAHVFVDLAGADGTASTLQSPRPVLTLIDLQRVMRPKWLMGRWIVKDLASLNYSCPREWVSRCDRVRWLKAYRGVRRLTLADKRLARRIEAKTLRIARHDASRRRRLGLDPTGAASSRTDPDGDSGRLDPRARSKS